MKEKLKRLIFIKTDFLIGIFFVKIEKKMKVFSIGKRTHIWPLRYTKNIPGINPQPLSGISALELKLVSLALKYLGR